MRLAILSQLSAAMAMDFVPDTLSKLMFVLVFSLCTRFAFHMFPVLIHLFCFVFMFICLSYDDFDVRAPVSYPQCWRFGMCKNCHLPKK